MDEDTNADADLTLEQKLESALEIEPSKDETATDPAAKPEAAPAAAADPAAVDPAAAGADPAAKADPAKPATDKAVDPDLYAPLPEHNQRRTHERFAKLVEGHKAATAERDEAVQKLQAAESRVQEHEQGWRVFQEMGFDSQEAVNDLAVFADYRRALGSGNWDACAQILQQQAQQLALMSGRKIDVDPLASFPDLNQRFQTGAIDEATAMEVAAARHRQQLAQQHQQRQQAEQHQTEQQREVILSGARAVDQVVSELMKDPDYAKVEPALLQQLADIKANYMPSQWAREIKRAYDTEARIMRAAAVSAPTPAPLRASGHPGGQPQPKSMADAVLMSLGLGQ